MKTARRGGVSPPPTVFECDTAKGVGGGTTPPLRSSSQKLSLRGRNARSISSRGNLCGQNRAIRSPRSPQTAGELAMTISDRCGTLAASRDGRGCNPAPTETTRRAGAEPRPYPAKRRVGGWGLLKKQPIFGAAGQIAPAHLWSSRSRGGLCGIRSLDARPRMAKGDKRQTGWIPLARRTPIVLIS